MPKPPPIASHPSRLDVLAPSGPGGPLPEARRLPLDRVDANAQQARQVFDEAALAELAQSIAAHGVLEPILVRPIGDRFQVVAGERRTRAARQAGLTEIPAIMREMTDEEAAYVTAIENLQRADLDLEDEARWFVYLQELTGLSDRQLAERLGKHKNYVNRRLRMLRKRPDLFARIRAGELTQQQALQALVERDDAPDPVDHGGPLTTEGSSDPMDHGGPLTTVGSSPLTERVALDGGPTPTAFRWRPWQQFATVLTKTRPEDVPADDRATFRAQVAAMRAQLEALEAALEDEG